jgi:hypothetical protein
MVGLGAGPPSARPQSPAPLATLAGGHAPAAAAGEHARRWARSARGDPPHRTCHGSRWKDGNCDACAEGFFGPHCAEVFIVSGTPDSDYSGMYVNASRMCHGKPEYKLGGDGGGKWLHLDRPGDGGYWAISGKKCDGMLYGLGYRYCSKGPDECPHEWFVTGHGGDKDVPSLTVMASCNGTACSCDGDWGGLDCDLPNCSKCTAPCVTEQRCDCNCTTGHTV